MGTQDSEHVFQLVLKQYEKKTKKSRLQHAEAKKYLPGGDTRSATYFSPYPTYMASGNGCWLYDIDDNKYLDFLNNYSSLVHGHAHPKITERMRSQLSNGLVLGAASDLQHKHARHLKSRMPSLELVRYCNSGSEATLFAMRAARAFTGKEIIVKMDGGYHGSHDFVEVNVNSHPVQSATLEPRLNSRGVPRCVKDTLRVAPFNDLHAIENLFKRETDRIAAVIVEPLLGAGGVIPPAEGYLEALRELTQEYEILLVFDEVMTFRLSTGGLQLIHGIQPDITALGKIIGGGLPVGAFGGRKDIMASFDPTGENHIPHSGTFNGNNITMAAGLCALELYDAKSVAHINRLGDKLRSGFNQVFRKTGIKGQAIGFGSLSNIHWYDGSIENAGQVAKSNLAAGKLPNLLHLSLLNRGIYSAGRGMFVISTPMKEEHIDFVIKEFEDILENLRPYIAAKTPHLIGQ